MWVSCYSQYSLGFQCSLSISFSLWWNGYTFRRVSSSSPSLNILLPEWEKTQDWIFRSILLKRPNEFHYSWVDSVDSVDQWTGSCAFHTLQSASSCNPRTIHTVPTLCNRRAMAVFLAAIVHRPMNRNKFIKSILFKHLTVLGCLT